MGIKNFFNAFKEQGTQKATGAFLAAAGIGVASIDAIRLASGDLSGLTGQWFAAGTGMAMTGLQMMRGQQESSPIVVIVEGNNHN